jgi:hypothetical protein
MIGSRWFQKSTNTPTGVSPNERFTERLDTVWFKKPGGGLIRLGMLLTRILSRLDSLEQAAKPTQPSSMNRTATGVVAQQQPYKREPHTDEYGYES